MNIRVATPATKAITPQGEGPWVAPLGQGAGVAKALPKVRLLKPQTAAFAGCGIRKFGTGVKIGAR